MTNLTLVPSTTYSKQGFLRLTDPKSITNISKKWIFPRYPELGLCSLDVTKGIWAKKIQIHQFDSSWYCLQANSATFWANLHKYRILLTIEFFAVKFYNLSPKTISIHSSALQLRSQLKKLLPYSTSGLRTRSYVFLVLTDQRERSRGVLSPLISVRGREGCCLLSY